MKRRLFVLSLSAAPIAAHAQPAASQSADWQTIVGRDLRFRLEMPAPATETKAAEKAFPRAKFKYVRDEPIGLQGWDGYALDIEDAQGAVVQMRTYIVKDRLFRLLVTAKNNEASKAAAKRFLDSLRLAETRPS